MRKVAKKVCKLSLFSQLSAPIKSGVSVWYELQLLLIDYSQNFHRMVQCRQIETHMYSLYVPGLLVATSISRNTQGAFPRENSAYKYPTVVKNLLFLARLELYTISSTKRSHSPQTLILKFIIIRFVTSVVCCVRSEWHIPTKRRHRSRQKIAFMRNLSGLLPRQIYFVSDATRSTPVLQLTQLILQLQSCICDVV